MKKFMNEFKQFAVKGNAIDLAVGVIIGAAFGAIIASLVTDILMPIVGMFLNGTDFSSWVIMLPSIYSGADQVVLNIGLFINAVINFIIIALVVFLMIRKINKMTNKQEKTPAEVAPSKEVLLLTEIRDLLKDK